MGIMGWVGGGHIQEQGNFQIRKMKPSDMKSGLSSTVLLETGSDPRDPESHLLGTPQDCAAFSVRNGVTNHILCVPTVFNTGLVSS